MLGGFACSDYEVKNLTVEDVFEQTQDPPADVLFVVDNSQSMSEEQLRLSENFGTFVELLTTTTADYRLGVTTTDPAQGGVLVGEVITPDTPDPVVTFSTLVGVGTSGDRDEQGLAMAALGTREDVNLGFLRSDAVTHVVFVSDEDDHSPEANVQRYVDAMLQNKPGESLFAHALVGDPPAGCLGGTSAADAGTRYLEAVELIGGLRESICADDYGVGFEAIGLEVSGGNPVFPLSQLAARETIEVWVEEVKMYQREIDGWTSSIGDNAVVFSGHAIPRPGMGVRIAYQPG